MYKAEASVHFFDILTSNLKKILDTAPTAPALRYYRPYTMFYHWLQTGLATTLLISSINAQPDTPEVVFDCSVTPYACTNMCWGAYCSNYEVSLNFDAPSEDTKKQRRTKAGCKPNPNRCNKPNNGADPTNISCDEYPFASTSNADDVQAVTRCVPSSDNNST